MDDQLYNQIFLKPRFQLEMNFSAEVLLSKITEVIRNEKKYRIKLVDHHIIIDIPEKESHFWSPQLHMEIEEENKDTSKIRGLFGPKPHVWTLFMFIHFGVALAFFIFAVIAYSNHSLGNSITFPVIMLIILPLLWITLYWIGRLGKSFGQNQMDELKSFTESILKEIE
ncbi:MAG: GTP-binding protein [Tenacibaculum sp.]|nr:GTP-binding protein [Tenacibaculum sp.]